MSARSFRPYIEDCYLHCYMLLCSTYGEQGAQKFHGFFLSKLSSAADALDLEACMFFLKSVEVALKDDGYASTLGFVEQAFTLLMSNPSLLSQPIVLKSFCQLVKEFASFFTLLPKFVGPTLKIVLSGQT